MPALLRLVEGTPAKVHLITTNPAADFSFTEVVVDAVPATSEECVKIGYFPAEVK